MIKRAPTRRHFLWAGQGPIAELAEEFCSFETDIMAWRPQGVQTDLKREFTRAITEGEHKALKESFEEGPTKNTGTDSEGGDIPRVVMQDYG